MTGMKPKAVRFHAHNFAWHRVWYEQALSLVLAIAVFAMPVGATRFQNRSLFMQSVEPGVTTTYTISLRYMTPGPVGSLDLLFCTSPLPDEPCVPPPGMDVSQAVLATQSGEDGFSFSTRTTNHLIMSRPPTPIDPGEMTKYTIGNIVNQTNVLKAFAIRMNSYASTDATGPYIDFGSVMGTVSNGIVIETQVPPTLMFCLAEQVEEDCSSTNDTYYQGMGELSPTSTLTAQSQMAVGTNASGGFAITANGTPMAAGTSVIDSPTIPTESRPGTNQFGINLVANNSPLVGSDPEGAWLNAVPMADYGMPNRYKYVPGDVVAFSPNVSLMKKFTVSYIVNSNKDLRPGVYSTTITFIASGRF